MIFGPKRDGNGEWRRLHNEELHSLYRSPITGKPTGKRPLGRPRRRWEDNLRMDLENIGINPRNWVHSVQDRDYWRALVNTTLKLRVP